ncbi:phage tail protein [Mucilaginibacter robiniae]|uniref:Phage tail protein n=1 Tax=Mucilaginibacter robiniae TaxID=2728022 RepID=A0A7L5DZJ2_9SPHI|nr:phage tail protein [Mucilaginibacter robiniae]QJD96201.1 phage tail protein [Mucilaginibacter robiniae]
MADDGSAQGTAIWPLVKFAFSVKWDTTELVFQEVTGLNAESQVIEYRGGNSKDFTTVKMPGLQKFGNITFKKGIFKGDVALWTQFATIKMNTFKRIPITVSLLDETGKEIMTWTLKNAFPTKYSGTDMKSDGNEVAIETLEVAHEGLTLKAE